jgi:hypothetical protein
MNSACLLLLGLAALLLASCSQKQSTTFNWEMSQTPRWQNLAARLKTGKYTAYYQGAAVADPASQPGQWSGRLTGDIVVIEGISAVVVMGGSASISPEGKLSVSGSSRTVIVDKADL